MTNRLLPTTARANLGAMGKPLRCYVGLHRWEDKYDHERSMRVKECQLCGKRIAKSIAPPNVGGGGPPGNPFG